jgi:hypothetical protein
VGGTAVGGTAVAVAPQAASASIRENAAIAATFMCLFIFLLLTLQPVGRLS